MSLSSHPVDLTSQEDFLIRPRAGFWRRFLAFLIDTLIVGTPFKALAVLLYLSTAGVLQSFSPSTGIVCRSVKELTEALDPLPPVGNSVADCRLSFLGMETAHGLQVLNVTHDTPRFSFTGGAVYSLGLDGRQVKAQSVDWTFLLAFAAYLIFFQYRFGATLGMRALKIGTISNDNPEQVGISWQRATSRTAASIAGFIPLVVLWSLTPVAFLGSGFFWFFLAVAGTLGLLWLLWIAVAIFRKRDPPHDLMARTAVVFILFTHEFQMPVAKWLGAWAAGLALLLVSVSTGSYSLRNEGALAEKKLGSIYINIFGIFLSVGANGFPYPNDKGQDYSAVVQWYLKAAEKGYASAQANLGMMYSQGQGVQQDYAEAVSWLQKAADKGDAAAENNLGFMYLSGHGVAAENAEAIRLFREAAAQGNAQAESNLGLIYRDGLGVPKDYTEAVSWFRKGADKGDATAEDNLGVMYLSGHGVAADNAEAMSLFREAAAQGNVAAQHNLGFMYANGVGQDYTEALRWYQKAADQGYAPAQTNIGLMYRDGKGVTQSNALAYMWLSLAVNGLPPSENRNKIVAARDDLASKMTSQQIAEAQRLTSEWKPKKN
jgi:TPR repeat protein/uncharacterized RDD family membrane protein YckC